MARRPPPPPPPQYFPQPFANPGVENNSRSAIRNATQLTTGNPPGPAVYHPQVPNDGTYPPQQPVPYTPLLSSAPPPVHRTTRPPAPAPASAPTYPYSPPPLHSSGTVPQRPSFPIPDVPGGYGAPSNPSGPPPPPPPTAERLGHNVQGGYHNVAVPYPYHQRPTTTLNVAHQAGGSGSYENQDFGQRQDMTGNMNDYSRERAPTSLPFAGIGHTGRRQHTSGAEEQVPQPDLPCKRLGCQRLTPPDEYARLGGFCSERHKWEWHSSQNQNQPPRVL